MNDLNSAKSQLGKQNVNLRLIFNRIAQNLEYSECLSAIG